MIVRIVKADNPNYWYYHSVGKVFRVVECPDGEDEESYLATTRCGIPSCCTIRKQDCEVVSDV